MKTSFTLCVAILLFALVSSDVTEGGIDATHDFEELQSENIDAWVDHPAAVEEYLEVYSTLAPDTVSTTDSFLMSIEIRIQLKPHNYLLTDYF